MAEQRRRAPVSFGSALAVRNVPRHVWVTAGLAAFVWALAAAAVALAVMHERHLALQRAAQSAMALTLVMDAHTARTLQSVELVLAGVSDAYALNAPATNDPQFRNVLRARLQDLPYVRAIFVIGPDGTITHDTDYPDTPHVSLADRNYFKRHVADAALARHIGPPLLSRSGHGWFNAVTQRLTHDGTFAGVAVAAVQPEYFEQLYQRMALGEGQVIELFYKDLTRVARFPRDETLIGHKTSPEALYGASGASAAGTHTADNGLLDVRMTSWRRLEGQPFIVALSQGAPALLAGWRTMAITALAGMAAAALLIAVVVMQLLRRRQLAEQARERSAQAEKLEAVGQLTSGVAHDFANLLGIVATNLSLVQRLAPNEAPVNRAVATAQRAVDTGRRLIEQLLGFARQQRLDVRAIDLAGTMRTHAPMIEQAAGSGVAVAWQLAEPPTHCLADETQLVVALVNLVANARDAMDGQGSITLRATTCGPAELAAWGLPKNARFACITVTDTGPGMSDAVRRRVFEPFFTTKGPAGTGLGLAQVYGFVRQLGGDVRVESRLGHGTAVTLCLPLVPPADGAMPAPADAAGGR